MNEKWFRYRTTDDDLGILFHQIPISQVEQGFLLGRRILSRDEGFDIFDKNGNRLYEHDYITFLNGTHAEILLIGGIVTVKNSQYETPFKLPWSRVVEKVGSSYTRLDLTEKIYGEKNIEKGLSHGS